MNFYLTRDADGELMLTNHLPFKRKFYWTSEGNYLILPKKRFKKVKWEDEEPTEVRLEELK